MIDIEKVRSKLTMAGAKKQVVGYLNAQDQVKFMFLNLDLTTMGVMEKGHRHRPRWS